MTRVKICGLTDESDLIAAVEAGADFVGFIFHPPSPRFVPPERVQGFMETLRGLDVPRVPLCVGVFVNPDPAYVDDVLSNCGLQAAQVHRMEPAALHALHLRLNGALYPAFQPRNLDEGLSLIEGANAPDEARLDTPFWLPDVLIDAYHPERAGGTGQLADLEMARRLALQARRMMLAGGLTPENVAGVIRVVRPWAVDVASGVEAAPGRKDHDKIRAFIRAVREVED